MMYGVQCLWLSGLSATLKLAFPRGYLQDKRKMQQATHESELRGSAACLVPASTLFAPRVVALPGHIRIAILFNSTSTRPYWAARQVATHPTRSLSVHHGANVLPIIREPRNISAPDADAPPKSRSPRKLLPGKANFPSRARKLTFHNKTDFEKSIFILAVRAPASLLRLFYGRSNDHAKYLVGVVFASALHYEQVHRISCPGPHTVRWPPHWWQLLKALQACARRG